MPDGYMINPDYRKFNIELAMKPLNYEDWRLPANNIIETGMGREIGSARQTYSEEWIILPEVIETIKK